jgi:hypothetical protein
MGFAANILLRLLYSDSNSWVLLRRRGTEPNTAGQRRPWRQLFKQDRSWPALRGRHLTINEVHHPHHVRRTCFASDWAEVLHLAGAYRSPVTRQRPVARMAGAGRQRCKRIEKQQAQKHEAYQNPRHIPPISPLPRVCVKSHTY